jgi:hypothetical protein
MYVRFCDFGVRVCFCNAVRRGVGFCMNYGWGIRGDVGKNWWNLGWNFGFVNLKEG